MEQNTAIIPLGDVQKMGEIAARSRLFGVDDPVAATALMLMAQAEGRHPMLAARDYHVIKGKPALKADAMLARFQQAGGKVEWQELTDQRVCATFIHPSAGSVTVDWDMDRARKAQLCGNPTWQKFPRAMLRSRVISEGIRTAFPAVLCGFYTKEEVEDIIYEEAHGNEQPAPEAATAPAPKRKSQKDALKAAAEKAAKKQEAVEVEAVEVKTEPAPAAHEAPAGFKKADASEIAQRLSAEAEEVGVKEEAQEAFAQAEAAAEAAPEPDPEVKPEPEQVSDDMAAWIEEAREAAEHGVTATDLKEKAWAKFGRPLPTPVINCLMEIHKSHKEG